MAVSMEESGLGVVQSEDAKGTILVAYDDTRSTVVANSRIYRQSSRRMRGHKASKLVMGDQLSLAFR